MVLKGITVFLMKNMQRCLCLWICVWACSALAASVKSPEPLLSREKNPLPPEDTGMIGTHSRLEYHEGLMEQCKEFPTPNLRQLCEKIAENPIIVAMKDRVRGNLKSMTTNVRKASRPGRKRHLNCPDYSLVSSHEPYRERSISPWQMSMHHDPSRYPQLLPKARCLCEGCIDQVSGRENKRFVSREIKVRIRLLRMNVTATNFAPFSKCTDGVCQAFDEDISVGCHCSIPVPIYQGYS